MPEAKQDFLKFRNSSGNKRAELLIYGDIGEWWADVSSADFAEKMAEVKGRDLDVYINSGGGSVFTASAILSQLKRHDAGVTVHIDGLAASAASFIAMAGDVIIMPANAMMFIHNPLTVSMGYASDMRKTADDLDRIREAIIAAYQEKTKLERDKIIEIMDAETWLTAEEAVELGFADEVGAAREYAASITGANMVLNGTEFDLSRFGNIPTQFLKNTKTKEPEKPTAGAPAEPVNKQEGSNPMDLEKLKAEHPELYKQVLNAGREEGIKAERERLQAIDDLGVQAHGDLVDKAKYKEPMNAGDLAMAVLKAEKEKGAQHLNNVEQDATDLENIEHEDPTNQDDKAAQKKQATANSIVDGIKAALGNRARKE